MFNLIKKDFLTLSKSKSDLIELLLMPLFLTAILGFALGDMIMSNVGIDAFDVGIVNNQNFVDDLDRLEEDFLADELPEEAVDELISNAEEVDPSNMLVDLLEEEGFEDLMIIHEFDDTRTAQAAMNENELSGLITIPEGFSYDIWRSLYFDEEPSAALEVAGQGEGLVSSTILQSVVHSFADQYNLETSIALATEGQAELEEEDDNDYGGVTQLSVEEEPVDAFQYYTVGMAMMFALSTAPALASRAFKEKEQHVFGRIMLSGTKPTTYLSSKMISGTLITFTQLMILFIVSTLLFGIFDGKDGGFWLDIAYTTGVFSLAVGGITSLLTAVSLYANDNTTVGFFSSFVAVFAFLGGSFTPVEQFSETLQQLGTWLPNGASMTAYLQILQGFSFQEVLFLMARVVGTGIICFIIAIIVFPKRRLD